MLRRTGKRGRDISSKRMWYSRECIDNSVEDTQARIRAVARSHIAISDWNRLLGFLECLGRHSRDCVRPRSFLLSLERFSYLVLDRVLGNRRPIWNKERIRVRKVASRCISVYTQTHTRTRTITSRAHNTIKLLVAIFTSELCTAGQERDIFREKHVAGNRGEATPHDRRYRNSVRYVAMH